MKIKYLGVEGQSADISGSVEVLGYGRIDKDQIVDMPDDLAKDLLATSKRQKFEVVNPAPEVDPAPEVETETATEKPKSKKS